MCCSVGAVCCSVLQRVAVCCSVLQCVVVCCSELQCVAVCGSVLQYVAVCCSVMQCVGDKGGAHWPNRLKDEHKESSEQQAVCWGRDPRL